MIRTWVNLGSMTLFTLRTPADILAVRFAYSPVWETRAAVRTFAQGRTHSYHEPWLRLVRDRGALLALSDLLALEPGHGYAPDFLTPPPSNPSPRLEGELAEIRATPPHQVRHELGRYLDTVRDETDRRLVGSWLADPAPARDLLATRLHEAWLELVAPFWTRVRVLLERDIGQRARTLARHGLRRVFDQLDTRVRWTTRGISCRDSSGRTLEVDERGLVLMPTAYGWPGIAIIADEPWLPTIVYPARGIGDLWRASTPPPDALARLLGRTRARVLTSLNQPLSTTTLATLLETSPAGASRHLLALRDAGLVIGTRHGHEVRYGRTELGSSLLKRCSA